MGKVSLSYGWRSRSLRVSSLVNSFITYC